MTTHRKTYVNVLILQVMEEITGDIGRISIDSQGGGRLYIPKSLMKKLPFKSGERVKITLNKNGTLAIEKLW